MDFNNQTEMGPCGDDVIRIPTLRVLPRHYGFSGQFSGQHLRAKLLTVLVTLRHTVWTLDVCRLYQRYHGELILWKEFQNKKKINYLFAMYQRFVSEMSPDVNRYLSLYGQIKR